MFFYIVIVNIILTSHKTVNIHMKTSFLFIICVANITLKFYLYFRLSTCKKPAYSIVIIFVYSLEKYSRPGRNIRHVLNNFSCIFNSSFDLKTILNMYKLLKLIKGIIVILKKFKLICAY